MMIVYVLAGFNRNDIPNLACIHMALDNTVKISVAQNVPNYHAAAIGLCHS